MNAEEAAGYLNFALDTAREAGALLMDFFGGLSPDQIGYKGIRNVVTAADTASEKLIVGRIRTRFPEHDVLAEEGAGRRTGSPRRWIIDPLDGTVNFAHGVPIFCVSLALEIEGVVRVGVVHAPYLRETFCAVEGGGARLNDEPCRVSNRDEMRYALLATGFAYMRDRVSHNNLDNFNRLSLAAEGVRRTGSAALDLCYVACGRYDGFWELFLSPWDVAAGALMVREAGGRVTDVAGGDDFLFGGNIVASNGLVHESLRSMLDPFPSEIDDRALDRPPSSG